MQSPEDHSEMPGSSSKSNEYADLERELPSRKELSLKDKEAPELREMLMSFGGEWSEAERQLVQDASDLASYLHKDDKYKGGPYELHVLRVANRVAGHLEWPNPNIVIAALMHDSVEDHAEALATILGQEVEGASELDLQHLALETIAQRFTPEAAEIVNSVTNPPNLMGKGSDEHRIERYVNKVEHAVETPEAWGVKFCDWCDNALGAEFSEDAPGSAPAIWRRKKYGRVVPIFEQRYQQPDLQSQLSPSAKQYVEQQFGFGHERLQLAV